MNNHYELSNIHQNHHGFHHTSVKKWGATWRVRPSARGPGWPFGAVLSPLYTEQRRGPRPHCLSDNWDVKPFTESSGEASKWKYKKRGRRGRGGEEKKKMEDKGDKGASRGGKHNPNFEDHVVFIFVSNRSSTEVERDGLKSSACCVPFGFGADTGICL